MTDPAAFIARRWYHDLDLTYAGVNFGEVICYDVLQVINRAILRQQELEAQQLVAQSATAQSAELNDGSTINLEDKPKA